jgi:DNA-binding response OmpR family regulator
MVENKASSVKTILVVEDDIDIGNFLVLALKQETPYEVLLASDGFQALEIVQALKPDLFVLDYLLPRMNGIELYNHLQAMEGFKDIPALFMSANTHVRELEGRRVYYIEKPFELDELLQSIDELLVD